MRSSLRLLAAAALAFAAIGPAGAELIVIDGTVSVRVPEGMELPKRGSSMQTVEARFGAPAARAEPVGQPPITRWDYPNFSVYFEFDKVLHAVVRGG